MALTVAVIGWGHFGRAFGERLLATGATVRAWDPSHPPPASRAAESLETAVVGSDFVVMAVPVPRLQVALEELRPLLKGDQVVLDVGSVKTGPVKVMSRILGSEIPWVATHPLFGPTSMALGEPLRVVICPNEEHSEAATKVVELYRRIGGKVTRLEAGEHDREMAMTHALTFFMAKGFMDAGVDLEAPNAPPSALAIARVVESVRRDGGHLFASLHRENPYADEARRVLLDALGKIDRALSLPEEDVVSDSPEVVIAPPAVEGEGKPETPPQLLEAREVIDELDRELLDLLVRRAELSLRAAQAKASVGRGIRDAGREQELLQRRRDMASKRDLDEVAVVDIFQAILRFSRAHQAHSEV